MNVGHAKPILSPRLQQLLTESLFLVANKKEYINRGYRKTRPPTQGKHFAIKSFYSRHKIVINQGTLLLFGLAKAAIKYKSYYILIN